MTNNCPMNVNRRALMTRLAASDVKYWYPHQVTNSITEFYSKSLDGGKCAWDKTTALFSSACRSRSFSSKTCNRSTQSTVPSVHIRLWYRWRILIKSVRCSTVYRTARWCLWSAQFFHINKCWSICMYCRDCVYVRSHEDMRWSGILISVIQKKIHFKIMPARQSCYLCCNDCPCYKITYKWIRWPLGKRNGLDEEPLYRYLSFTGPLVLPAKSICRSRCQLSLIHYNFLCKMTGWQNNRSTIDAEETNRHQSDVGLILFRRSD